jgi:putative ABC transport system permease protein
MQKDIIIYAFNNLKKRLLRSSLTIVSIFIGIMSIFVLISFGQGLSKYMDDIFEEMGTNKLMMMGKTFGPPGSGDVKFSKEDLSFVEKISGIDVVAPMYFVSTDIKIDGEKPYTTYVMGLPTTGDERDVVIEMLTVDVFEGRYLKGADRGKVIIGYNFGQEDKVFNKVLEVGDSIYIKNQELKIVGILDSIGNPQDDSQAYMSLEYYEELFDEDEYSMLYIQTKDGASPSKVADDVTERYRKRTDQKEGYENFYVQTFEDMMQSFGNIIGVINGVVLLIALISVVVAAINITNTMYTTVIERTQEIGIMKAIGATNEEILKIFLIESGMQGLIGGLIGLGLGYWIAKLGGAIAAASGYAMLQPYFPIWLIVFSLLFSTGMGAAAGFLPALQASKLKPVESLRYE